MDSNAHSSSMGDGAHDWGDLALFSSPPYDDALAAQSPFGTTAFTDFTNLDAFSDPSMNLNFLREPSRSGSAMHDVQPSQGATLHHSASAESSSQDSSSESSSRRHKMKVESQSPESDTTTETGLKNAHPMKQDSKISIGSAHQPVKLFDSAPSQPMHNLSLGRNSSISSASFEFTSSPIKTGDFNHAMSLNAHANMPPTSSGAQFTHDAPVQTINPGMFELGGGQDHSPGSTTNMFGGQQSPNGMFSTPSSDSPETFANPNWNHPTTQASTWANDYSGQLTSPGGSLSFTPSPVPNGVTTARSKKAALHDPSKKSPLHIAPISTKSRVETQINVIMTLERPPPGVEYLHLPLHTIAKSKLLAKEEYDRSRVLELHTMLVCTSAMHNDQMKEKALRQAAAQNNEVIQRRAEQARESPEDEKNDPKNVEEEDRPANGGEVRICQNCIQRERKRAGRKKTKREEEQQHWERYETERVVVFNSNEYLQFKACEPREHSARDGSLASESDYIPPEGAIYVTAAMRIACYCRHQSEKEGFQVIFTMKDQRGVVVAQQISDSILITDDHKTHPQAFSTPMGGDGYYQTPAYLPNGLPISHSMIDLNAHTHPFQSSRSHGNLQTLTYGPQYNTSSHVHQLSNSGFPSQTTSATMTPASLSRPASPNSAGQAGPNKKRKSSSFHRKLPSGLQMTPRVDTSQPPSSNMPSAMSMTSQFSPTFAGQMNQSYMTIPQNGGPAQYFGSGPPTPSEVTPFQFAQPTVDNSRQAYFSHPSSAVPSRASSPVMQSSRPSMSIYRQPSVQTSTNAMHGRAGMFSSGQSMIEANQPLFPTATRITPNEGPVAGGTEVVIFGENFVLGNQVMFGEQVVQPNFMNSSTLVAISPAGRKGSVRLTILPPPGMSHYPQPASSPIFRYVESAEEMMTLALKYLSQQQNGSADNWQLLAQQSAQNFNNQQIAMQSTYINPSRRGSYAATKIEGVVLNILDAVDMSDSTDTPDLEITSTSGGTMLSIACSLGMHRVVAGLLARGANPDRPNRAGFTSLMQAAVQGHVKIFQLLIAKGADSAWRSLNGYSALDLAPADLRDEMQQVLLNTRRRRDSRPRLLHRLSHCSNASSKTSWDISSASLYESEMDNSQPSTRRTSVHAVISSEAREGIDAAHSAPDAMVAWRDALAAQIAQFQEHVAANLPTFNLSPLPALPDCRRLSALVPSRSAALAQDPANAATATADAIPPTRPQRFWDVFSSASLAGSASNNAPPPAYHDIFPNRQSPPTSSSKDAKRSLQQAAIGAAVVDAVADGKCASMFEHTSVRDPANATDDSVPSKAARGQGGQSTNWLWIPIILVLLNCLLAHALLMPHLSSTIATYIYASGSTTFPRPV